MKNHTLKSIGLIILLFIIFPIMAGLAFTYVGYNAVSIDRLSDKIDTNSISDTYFKAKINDFEDLVYDSVSFGAIKDAVYIRSDRENFIAIFEKRVNSNELIIDRTNKAYDGVLKKGETLAFKMSKTPFFDSTIDSIVRSRLASNKLDLSSLVIAYHIDIEEVKSENASFYTTISSVIALGIGTIIFAKFQVDNYKKYIKPKK